MNGWDLNSKSPLFLIKYGIWMIMLYSFLYWTYHMLLPNSMYCKVSEWSVSFEFLKESAIYLDVGSPVSPASLIRTGMLGVYQILCEVQIIHSLLQLYDEGRASLTVFYPLTLPKHNYRISDFSPFMEKSKRKQSNPNTDVSLDQNSTRKIFQSAWAGS